MVPPNTDRKIRSRTTPRVL